MLVLLPTKVKTFGVSLHIAETFPIYWRIVELFVSEVSVILMGAEMA